MSFRLGVDVGGTFTDLLLIDDSSGKTWTAKVPSTPQDSSIGVLNGVARICDESGVDPAKIDQVMHGTTVATNAILTGRGASVGLVTTKGYRNVLQVARSFCPGGLGGWVSYVRKPLLAPLELTIEADERIDANGKPLRALDESDLRQSLEGLKAKGQVEAITICFINAYLNGAHEKTARKIAQEVFPDLPISVSSEVVPEMQEYERAETTVVNSYVRPEVENYVTNLQISLNQKLGDQLLSILRSDGGLASSEAAAESPVNLLLSGPAGGVTGAVHFAKQAGFENVLTFDMGGTSTDVALIQKGRARLRRETRVGDVNVRAPSIDVRTVGAGGGSIAFVPELTRALRVGPQSAGAEPGPAAYSKGGDEPTVCDANVVLGYLPADVRLGGKMTIDRGKAETAVNKIAEAMDIPLMEAAEGIVRIANEAMFGALRLVSVEQGYDPRDFALIGFGGAGPLHANALGILLNSWPVVIPPGPGVLCAYGDVATRIQNEAARSFVMRVEDIDEETLLQELESLQQRASQALIASGIPASEQETQFQGDMRYGGQAFQITLDFTEEDLRTHGLAHLTRRFNEEHDQLFTFSLESGHELVMLRAVVGAKIKHAPLPKTGKADASTLKNAELQGTEIWYDGKKCPAKIYDRSKLAAEAEVPGPAVICEMDSTTVVLPGHVARVDEIGNLLISPT